MKLKQKNPDAVGFTGYLGTTMLACCESAASAIMTTFFMLYLTDYAGIGKWGAILGTSLLLAARIFDAVNDPLQGYIIDKAKVGKHGKYRPFLLLSTILITIGVASLFSLPTAIHDSPVLICVWVIFFYFIYDMGTSFFVPQLLYRSMTLDANTRGKLLLGPRMINMAMGIVGSMLMMIITNVNDIFSNMNTAFSVTMSIFVISAGVLSLIGLLMVKEKYHAPKEATAAPVKITDIFSMLKENDALRVKLLETIFAGFVWTMLFAAGTYYVKWGYCTDLTTGVVDTEKFASLSMIGSMMSFIPLIVATMIATPLMKLAGSPIKFHRICLLCQTVPCGVMFLLHVLGILQTSPVLFYALQLVAILAIGLDFVPTGAMNMEVMDYEIYKNGRDRSALVHATSNFLGKIQSAVSSSIVGFLLIAVGYEVDSVTDTFLGQLSDVPNMLTGFMVIMGLIPCVLALIAFVITRKYPITNEIRAAMKEKLGK